MQFRGHQFLVHVKEDRRKESDSDFYVPDPAPMSPPAHLKALHRRLKHFQGCKSSLGTGSGVCGLVVQSLVPGQPTDNQSDFPTTSDYQRLLRIREQSGIVRLLQISSDYSGALVISSPVLCAAGGQTMLPGGWRPVTNRSRTRPRSLRLQPKS